MKKLISARALLILMINIGLASMLVWQWQDWSVQLPEVSKGAGRSGQAEASGMIFNMGNTSPQLFDEVSERPLFHADRTPVQLAEKKPQIQVPPPSGIYEVEGIASAGGRRIALLRDKRTNELFSVSRGDELGPWKVNRVRSDRIQLQLGEREEELLLETDETPRR